MPRKTLLLSIVTLTLFTISLSIHFLDGKRGADIGESSPLISGLNVDDAHKITLLKKGKVELSFVRKKDRYLIENHENYPVDPMSLNRLFIKLTELKVMKKVEDKSLNAQLKKKNASKGIIFLSKTGKILREVYLGDDKKNNQFYGRLGGDSSIYQLDGPLSLNFTLDSFIRKGIWNFDDKIIKKVVLRKNSEIQFHIEKEGQKIQVSPGPGDLEKIKKYLKDLSRLQFDRFSSNYNCIFNHSIEISTDQKVEYALQIGTINHNNSCFKVLARGSSDMPETVTMKKDMNTEKILGIDNLLKAQSELKKFNTKHSTWVYFTDKAYLSRFLKTLNDFKVSKIK